MQEISNHHFYQLRVYFDSYQISIPVALTEWMKSKLVSYFCSIHCIRKILLVGKNKQNSISKFILKQNQHLDSNTNIINFQYTHLIPNPYLHYLEFGLGIRQPQKLANEVRIVHFFYKFYFSHISTPSSCLGLDIWNKEIVGIFSVITVIP